MRFLLTVAMFCLVLAPAALHAQTVVHVIEAPVPPPSTGHPVGRHLEILVDDTGTGRAAGVYEIPVYPGRHITLDFPEDIERATGLPSQDFTIEVGARRAVIYPAKRRLKPGARRTVTFTCESAVLVFELRVATTPGDGMALVTVRKRSEKEAWEAALAEQRRALEEQQSDLEADRHALDEEKQALKQERQALSTERRELDDEKRQVARATAEAMDATAKTMLLNARRLKPVMLETGQENDLASVSLGYGHWFDDDTFYFPIKIHYRGAKPFLAGRFEVVDAAGTALDATLIGMDPPATAQDGVIATLRPDEQAMGVIKLSHMARSSFTGLTIRLIDATGLPAIVARTQPWEISPPYEPIFPGEKEARERERRQREREEQEKDRVSLHLQGVYGAIWLSDGIGLDRSDATSMTGLGVRARYAFNRYLAVEGEVLGARTGTARFDDVMYEGTQGNLARSGSLGRVQFGGVVRLGEQYIPILRLGVGGQGVSHTAVFNGTEEPEVPFEFSELWYAGAGLDVRLGEHFVAGFALSVEGPSRGSPSVEAGLHLGYSWKP